MTDARKLDQVGLVYGKRGGGKPDVGEEDEKAAKRDGLRRNAASLRRRSRGSLLACSLSVSVGLLRTHSSEEAESLESEAFRHLLEGVLDVLVFGIVLLARGVA